MTSEPVPVDVTNAHELRRLAEEVQRSGQPRLLRRDGEDLAVLSPVGPAARRLTQKAGPPTTGQVVRRGFAGSVAETTFGAVSARRQPEDFSSLRREFEESMADDVVAETTR